MLLTNKADNAPLRKKAIGEEWKALGLGQPPAIAANQGSGVGDVLDLAWTTLKNRQAAGGSQRRYSHAADGHRHTECRQVNATERSSRQ